MSLDRRSFMKLTGQAGGSLYFAFAIPGCAKASINPKLDDLNTDRSRFSTLYLEVTKDNKFILVFDRAEMGQGVITGQATLFGEEADIHPSQFEMRPAPADAKGRFGSQITGGSTTTKDRWMILRTAGAAYRHALKTIAARTWEVSYDSLVTDQGIISHAGKKKSVPYSHFNNAMMIEPVVESPPMKSPDDWKYIGKYNTCVDVPEKVRGVSEFGIDKQLPSLMTAIVIRSPVFGGELDKVDEDRIKKHKEVMDVVTIPSGVAIICRKYWQCLKIRSDVEQSISWKIPKELKLNTKQMLAEYHSKLKEEDSLKSKEKNASHLEAIYDLPFLAHAPLEPQNCVAWWKDDHFEVWAPTQAPQMLQAYAADLAGIDRKLVTIHVSKFLGGGFGRRSAIDFGAEAIEIAYQVKYPVKLMWSREDDMQHSPMRPMSSHKLEAIVDKSKGKILQWRHQAVGQSIMAPLVGSGGHLLAPQWLPRFVRRGVAASASGIMGAFDVLPMLGEGGEQAYDFPVEQNLIPAESEIPVTFWRSVGNAHNGFIVEGFLDEVATTLKKDPVDLRIELLHKNKRAQGVVKKVAELSDWKNKKPKSNRALGVAYHYSYKSYAAEVAEVEVKDEKIIVHKVWAAIDCGLVVNPEIVERQIRSGIAFGLSAALHGNITFKDGKVEQSNFHDYPVVMMSEMPDVEVAIINSDFKPTGVGEPGVPPIIPAVANAVFAATGKRLRETPFKLG